MSLGTYELIVLASGQIQYRYREDWVQRAALADLEGKDWRKVPIRDHEAEHLPLFEEAILDTSEPYSEDGNALDSVEQYAQLQEFMAMQPPAVQEIVRRRSEGENNCQIARAMGLDPTTILYRFRSLKNKAAEYLQVRSAMSTLGADLTNIRREKRRQELALFSEIGCIRTTADRIGVSRADLRKAFSYRTPELTTEQREAMNLLLSRGSHVLGQRRDRWCKGKP